MAVQGKVVEILWFGWCIDESEEPRTIRSLRSLLGLVSNRDCDVHFYCLGRVVARDKILEVLREIRKGVSLFFNGCSPQAYNHQTKFDSYFTWVSQRKPVDSLLWTLDGDMVLSESCVKAFWRLYRGFKFLVAVTDQCGDRRHHYSIDVAPDKTNIPLGICAGGSVLWDSRYLTRLIEDHRNLIQAFLRRQTAGYIIDDVILFELVQVVDRVPMAFCSDICTQHPESENRANSEELLKQLQCWKSLINRNRETFEA